jgi:alkanesulfonate monooxygenase SsuD/methylene tetrahydromethanopterin reductase-like flavin-dependent oxidoreductase (luciferase family)
MRFGLALPQYDYSIAGESPLPWARVVEWARAAEASGVHSLWMSDHLFLDVAKYGGPPDREGCLDPIVALAALAGEVPRVRLGTLVLCEAFRPAAVLAKALAGLDVVCDGRLDVGIGAGWYEPEYAAIGMEMPPPGERIARLREAILILRGLLGGGPCSFDGVHHRADGAVNTPPAVQQPRPPIFVGGKGDRLLSVAAEVADGWNTCWVWTPDAYRQRLDVLARACEAVERDPASVTRSLGLYTLCGEDERDLERRFERLQAVTPRGVLDGVTLDQWREGRLVGTVEQVREQAAGWAGLGVETLIVGLGAVPFAVTALDDLEMVAEAVRV